MISQPQSTQLRLDGKDPPPVNRPRQPLASTPLVDTTYLVALAGVDVRENLTTLNLGTCKLNPWHGSRKKRGNVRTLSNPSRFRLMRTLSAVRWRELPAPVWCTLTYHHAGDVHAGRAVSDLHAWLSRIKRKFGSTHYVWRLEMQKRGVPHFHVVLWPPDHSQVWQQVEYRQWVGTQWHEVVSPGDRAHAKHGAKIDQLDSYRHAAIYVSKYVSKEHAVDGVPYLGRRWGTSRGIPMDSHLSEELPERTVLLLRRKLRRYIRSVSRNRARADRYIMGGTRITLFVPHEVVERLLNAVLMEQEQAEPWPPPWNSEL